MTDRPAGTSGEQAGERFAELYGELRAMAAALLRYERPNHTLSPTALIHEAYLRLRKNHKLPETEQEFRAAVAGTIRRVLVDHARKKKSITGGGRERHVAIETGHLLEDAATLEVLDLHDTLERLAEISPERARIVELRFFGGLTEAEVAEALDISRTHVQGHWRSAKAWLRTELGKHP